MAQVAELSVTAVQSSSSSPDKKTAGFFGRLSELVSRKTESHFSANIDRQGAGFCLMCSAFTSINIFQYKRKVFKDFAGLEELASIQSGFF